MSQTDAIRDYLLAGHALTGLEAIDRFGCIRLASRINDLRKRGIDIRTETVELTNGKHVARYSIPLGQLKLFAA